MKLSGKAEGIAKISSLLLKDEQEKIQIVWLSKADLS